AEVSHFRPAARGRMHGRSASPALLQVHAKPSRTAIVIARRHSRQRHPEARAGGPGWLLSLRALAMTALETLLPGTTTRRAPRNLLEQRIVRVALSPQPVEGRGVRPVVGGIAGQAPDQVGVGKEGYAEGHEVGIPLGEHRLGGGALEAAIDD